jgi:hypothetical protein
VEVLSVVALVVGLVALVLSVLVWRRVAARDGDGVDALPEDVHGLRQEVAALRAEARGALRHLAVVRYDAFGDMGGHLSWSLAVLDDSGDGVVLTSIHGRSEARSYAKSVAGWRCEQQLSPEEQQAIERSRP